MTSRSGSGRIRRSSAFVVLLVSVLVSVTMPSSGSASAADSDLLDLAQLLPDPTIIHPHIAARVDVELKGMGVLATQLSKARQDLLEAEDRLANGQAEIARLTSQAAVLRAEMIVAGSDEAQALTVLEDSQADLGAFAVGAFVGSGALDLDVFSTKVSPSAIPSLTAAAEDTLLERRWVAGRAFDAAEAVRVDLESRLAQAAVDQAAAEVQVATAETDRVEAWAVVDRLGPAFEDALLLVAVTGTDFPVVVLDAYYRAALTTAETKPWCGVRWDQLAGIGRVESRHGTYGGTSVGADGRTVGEILGPVLDGTRFASIPDTDGGAWDGDTVWDRAVGPMQFIPGSWKRFGQDGNGDGVIDPHNLYDAALAAANHLCGSSRGLGDAANYQRALLGYNRSVSYGIAVMGYANAYRNMVDLGARDGADSTASDQASAVRTETITTTTVPVGAPESAGPLEALPDEALPDEALPTETAGVETTGVAAASTPAADPAAEEKAVAGP